VPWTSASAFTCVSSRELDVVQGGLQVAAHDHVVEIVLEALQDDPVFFSTAAFEASVRNSALLREATKSEVR